MDVWNSSTFNCPLENGQGSKAIIFQVKIVEFKKLINNNLWLFGGVVLFICTSAHQAYQRYILKDRNYYRQLFTIICFLLAILITPIIICFVPAIACYRFIVFIYLKQKWKDSFKGLLKGPDAMWAIETPESRSIINVLILVEVPLSKMKYYRGASSAGKNLLHTVRNITDRSFLQHASSFPKLKWLRQKCRLGYYYWIHYNESTIEQFVRPLQIAERNSDGITKKELECLIGKCSNKPLPFDDNGTWEILVGQQNLVDTEIKSIYPILVRIHHSVGDGVALLRLFLEGLLVNNYTSLPATLRKTVWAESRCTKPSTESVEYDNDDSDNEKKDVHSVYISPSRSRWQDSNPPECVIIPQPNENQKNNLKVKVANTLRNILTKITKKNSTLGNTSTKKKIVSPTKIKSFYLKERPESIVWKLCKSPGHTKRCDHVSSEIKTCVVPPRPRSVSPLRKISNEITPPSTLQQTIKCDFEKKNDLKNCENHDSQVDKCVSSKSHTIPPIYNSKEKISLKSLILYLLVAILVSVVCIRRTLILYFKILHPKIKKCFLFCYLTPHVMFCQLFESHKNDVLYGKELTGNKVLSWAIDDNDVNKSFRKKIKQIRDYYGVSTKFTHILYACLSKSLHRYYLQRNAKVPPYINVVLPARVNLDDISTGCQTTSKYEVGSTKTKVTRLYGARKIPKIHRPVNLSFSSSNESETEEANRKINDIHSALSQASTNYGIKLENKFTVAMMKLPIGSIPLDQDSRLIEAIQLECHRLKNGPDYLANYWLLRWFAHLVPNPLLEPFLKAAPCTLVFSNLPGPEDIVNLTSFPIHEIIFWVPNRGLNGIGMGMLSYCGRFSTGIIIDKALISNDGDAQKIVEGIYDEVNVLLRTKGYNAQLR